MEMESKIVSISRSVLCAAVLIVAAGCVTQYRDSGADYLELPVNTSYSPYYTEYSVSEKKIFGNGNASMLFGIFSISEGKFCRLKDDPKASFASQMGALLSPTQKAIYNAKSAAVYQACERANADQLLGAVFDYKITDCVIFVSVECTVKGYPASVRSVKMLDRQPVILNNWQRIEYLRPHETPRIYSGPKSAVAPGRESVTQKN